MKAFYRSKFILKTHDSLSHDIACILQRRRVHDPRFDPLTRKVDAAFVLHIAVFPSFTFSNERGELIRANRSLIVVTGEEFGVKRFHLRCAGQTEEEGVLHLAHHGYVTLPACT